MAFISGNNLGGKDIDYYDNPNYDPKKDGKSSTDYIKKSAKESANWAEQAEEAYLSGVSDDYQAVVESEVQSNYDKSKADKQASETVSYFRARERERLNPGGAGGKLNNPKFSKPSGTIEDKVAKFGMSFDPTDPDTYYDQAQKVPEGQLTENLYDTSRKIGNYDYFEETSRYAKGEPMPKTVAGVNQELQAIKARTRDAAMEFRGRVYDFIDEVTQNIHDDFAYQSIDWDAVPYSPGGTKNAPPTYSSIENKYFPNTGEKSKARNTILKMIDSTDNEPPLNTLRGVTEEMAAVKDPGLRDMGIGTSKLNKWGASNENTLKNLEAGIKEFQAWKAKKGCTKNY